MGFEKCVCVQFLSLGHEPSALDTVEAFHPQRNKWERLAPMHFPRCSSSSIVIRDRLLVVGGVNQVDHGTVSRFHTVMTVKWMIIKVLLFFTVTNVVC